MKFIHVKLNKYTKISGTTLLIDNNQRQEYNKKNFEAFSKILHSYSDQLSAITLPNIQKKSLYGCIIIEDRESESLESMIKYMILTLENNFSFYVFGFKKNETFLTHLIPKIHKNINLHILPYKQINNSTMYNQIILEMEIWNVIQESKVLMYQLDSFIFNPKNINHFMQYDYIGAFWPHLPFNLFNGNGGFSIRNVLLMKQIISMKKIFPCKYPEDIYIALCISKYRSKLIEYHFPKIEECVSFSIENLVQNKNNLTAGHQFWFCLENWESFVHNSIQNVLKQYSRKITN